MQNQVNSFVIFLILVIPSSFMYNFDWPQSLSTVLQDTPYFYSLKQVQLYYTIPQLIALLMYFKLGMIFDKMKLEKLLLLVPSIIFISQTLVAITFIYNFSGTYYISIIFRILFILMGESTYILQAIMLGKMLGEKASLLLGFGEVIPGVFEPLNSLLTPILFSYTQLIIVPLFTGSGICLVVLLCCIYLKIKIKELKIQQIQWIPHHHLNEQVQQTQHKTLFQQARSFSLQFWSLQLQIFLMYISTNVFVSIATDLIVKRFQIEYKKGGQLVMIPFLTSALFASIWVYVIKKFPFHRRNFFLIINFIGLISHISLYFLPNSDNDHNLIQIISITFIFSFIGIATSGLTIIIVPTVYLVSKKQQAGAAFSFVAISSSLAYVLVPSLISQINQVFGDQKIGYGYTSFVFIGFSILGIINTGYIELKQNFNIYDKNLYENQNNETKIDEISKIENIKTTITSIKSENKKNQQNE